MTNIYFTSDLHFGHERLLTLGRGRPFKTIEEHDKALIERWNQTVEPGSIVYILGDIFFKKYKVEDMERVFQSLHGEKRIILGNHDKKSEFIKLLNKGVVKSVSDYCEKEINTNYGKFFVVMSHYPILEFNKAFKPKTIMLYGHTHGTDCGFYDKIYDSLGFKAYEVGVDTNNFAPQHIDSIIARSMMRIKIVGTHVNVKTQPIPTDSKILGNKE